MFFQEIYFLFSGDPAGLGLFFLFFFFPRDSFYLFFISKEIIFFPAELSSEKNILKKKINK